MGSFAPIFDSNSGGNINIRVVLIFLVALSPLSATYLLTFGENEISYEQKEQLFELILKGEPPRIFYDPNPIDLNAECHKLAPAVRLEWIPPSIWQLGVLHIFFHQPAIRDEILACCQQAWEPLEYEQPLHHRLTSAQNLDEILDCFDRHSRTFPHLCELFFQINQSLIALHQRAHGSDREMLRLIISELPPFHKWRAKGFPFWQSPWIHNSCSVEAFYSAIKDTTLLTEVLEIERLAYKNEEWVLYRGYSGIGYPSTLQLNAANSHALSFGSTLLGGTFFSLEAAAITYSKPITPTTHSFIALRVRPQELIDLFRVGPLHPFLQLLADGEMFHAHTKIATKDSHEHKSLDGYFMNCNKRSVDPIGYITAPNMTPEELEKKFASLCERSSHIFLYNPTDKKL